RPQLLAIRGRGGAARLLVPLGAEEVELALQLAAAGVDVAEGLHERRDLAAAPEERIETCGIQHRRGTLATLNPGGKARVDRNVLMALAEPLSDAVQSEDEVLVDKFRGGDAKAFEELVKRHQRAVFYLARRFLRDDDEAKDVAQRAFVKAYQ